MIPCHSMQLNRSDLSLETVKAIAAAIEEKKGRSIYIVDLRDLSTLCDYCIIAEGSVDRHVKALSQNIQKVLSEKGLHPVRVEGESLAEWIVLDYSDIMVHLFVPELRERYQLEQLWK